MKHIISLLIFICIFGLTIQHTFAADAMDDNAIAFRGFGTLGISCFSSDSYFFVRDERPDGPGKPRRCDTGLDSLLGLQLDTNLTTRIQGTLQATSYHRADFSYFPELTLANLRFVLNNNNAVRVGRIQNPIFLESDNRNILYTQPWARPPTVVYNLVQAYSIEGIELNHRQELNEDALTFQGGLARTNFDSSNGTKQPDPVKVKFAYLDVISEQGDWLFKGSVLSGLIDYSTPDVDNALSYLDSLGASSLASSLSITNKHILFLGLGTRYETNLWYMEGEYIYRHIDSFYRDTHAAYLMTGRHFGDWMPYAIISKRWSKSQDKENQATDPTQYSVAKALDDATNVDCGALALGLSLKVTMQAVLKFQMDFYKPDTGSIQPAGTQRLTSLNLDFVF